ncbi:hypothetical protein [Dickeya oryzae]
MCNLPINNPELMKPINRLLRAGINVVDYHATFRRPIIEVDRPFAAWEPKAVEITETKKRCTAHRENDHLARRAHYLEINRYG